MKKSVADKWVQALRSGKYKQTRDVLQNKDGYCCLGVLCDISPTKIPKIINYDLFINGYLLGDQRSIKDWAGVKTDSGLIGKPTNSISMNELDSLVVMNDNGFSFDEIADIIQILWREL